MRMAFEWHLPSRKPTATCICKTGCYAILKTLRPRLDPQKSEWNVDQRRLINGKDYKRRVRALDNSAA